MDAEKQLKSFVDKFEPKHQRLIRDVRKTLRARFKVEDSLPEKWQRAADHPVRLSEASSTAGEHKVSLIRARLADPTLPTFR
jgi:hypothetical protein